MFGVDDALLAIIIGGAASAGAAGINAAAAGNASNAQQASAQDALNFQRQMWEQQQYNQAPWLEAGRNTLGELLRQMQTGEFDQPFGWEQLADDPGYQFRMAEGQKALERSASARGMLNSGAALKSLSRYSQGVASDEYQNAWARRQAEDTGRYNRLASLAGVGQTAAQNLGAFGSQAASNMGNIYGAMGNAQAAGSIATGNAFSGPLGMLGGAGIAYGLMNGGGGGGEQAIPTQSYGYSATPGPSNGIPYHIARP